MYSAALRSLSCDICGTGLIPLASAIRYGYEMSSALAKSCWLSPLIRAFVQSAFISAAPGTPSFLAEPELEFAFFIATPQYGVRHAKKIVENRKPGDLNCELFHIVESTTPRLLRTFATVFKVYETFV
jgi:hypothetical protein